MSKDLTGIFTMVVNKAIATAEKDVYDGAARAKVYTDIALAIAKTGCVTMSGIASAIDVPTSKEDLEVKPDKKKPAKAAAKEEPVVDPKEDEQEWGDPDLADKYKKEQDLITTLSNVDKEMGTNYLMDMVSEFSAGKLKSQEDIKPFNIVAVTTYIREVLAQKWDFLRQIIENNEPGAIESIIAPQFDGFTSIDNDINDGNISIIVDVINQAIEESESATAAAE